MNGWKLYLMRIMEDWDRRLTKDEDFDIGSDFADYLKRSY